MQYLFFEVFVLRWSPSATKKAASFRGDLRIEAALIMETGDFYNQLGIK